MKKGKTIFVKKYEKTLEYLLNDFNDHLFLLRDAFNNRNKNKAYYKTIAVQLRILLCDGPDGDIPLLFFIAKKFKFTLNIDFWGDGNITELKNYLENLPLTINGVDLTGFKFIREMCGNLGGSHIKDYINEMGIVGDSILIGGINSNNKMLESIASFVLKSANDLVIAINNKKT